MFHICFYLALLCLSTCKVTGHIAYPNRSEALDSDDLKRSDFADLLLERILEGSDEQVDEQLKRNEKNIGSQACPNGWLANDGSCYFFGSVNVNFQSAKEYCYERGGHLVNLEDEKESMFLTRFTKTTARGSNYWLGMTDAAEEGKWEWIGQDGEKSLVQYFDWGPNEPGDGNDDCALIARKGSKWADVNCQKKAKPLCEEKAVKACSTCADGWDKFGTSCYYFGQERLTFLQAYRKCQQMQGYPVQIESEAEWNFLKSQTEKKSLIDFWIGLIDVYKEAEWMWINSLKPVTFSKWNSGEPNNSGGSEHCVHMGRAMNYNWNDRDCFTYTASYVCEA